MKAVQIGNSKMYELFLCSAYDEEDEGKSCGYAIALNCADKVKNILIISVMYQEYFLMNFNLRLIIIVLMKSVNL